MKGNLVREKVGNPWKEILDDREKKSSRKDRKPDFFLCIFSSFKNHKNLLENQIWMIFLWGWFFVACACVCEGERQNSASNYKNMHVVCSAATLVFHLMLFQCSTHDERAIKFTLSPIIHIYPPFRSWEWIFRPILSLNAHIYYPLADYIVVLMFSHIKFVVRTTLFSGRHHSQHC